jgi:hypothetical protein
VRKGYDHVGADGRRATATVTTPGGARLAATDVYAAAPGGGFTVNLGFGRIVVSGIGAPII